MAAVRHWTMRLNKSAKRHALRSFGCIAILMIALGAAADAQNIVGIWQGTLPVGENPRIVLNIADAGNGVLRVRCSR